MEMVVKNSEIERFDLVVSSRTSHLPQDALLPGQVGLPSRVELISGRTTLKDENSQAWWEWCVPTLRFAGGRRGFSFFEIVVVLMLLSLAAALVAPSLSRTFERLELESSSRALGNRMKQLRSRAIGESSVYRILLGSSDEQDGASYALADEYEKVMERIQLPEGVELRWASQDDDDGPVRISFYPTGRSSGGTLEMSLGSRRMQVSVDPVTGLARVSRSQDQ